MPVKDFFRKIQPVQLYVVLTMTVLFFVVELIFSHLTHALTLLMDSYHTLCNILALAGCITTIKYENVAPQGSKPSTPEELTLKNECQDQKGKKVSQPRTKQEKKLINTFGWTRIDVVTMLICCVFLASFCFSIYVEALQTLIHIDHQDAMHQPVPVLCIGAAGLLLHGLCYLLIGGLTFHPESFLYVTESGDVMLNNVVVNGKTKQISSPSKRQGIWEVTRDVIGAILVIVCSLTVIFIDPSLAKFVDPAIALLSSTAIMFLSYPYIKESCMILLQTIPDTINIDAMKTNLMGHFPDIKNVHDFHIWQLTTSKVIATVHLIFENPKVYHGLVEQIKEFFLEHGVTQVTVQPEFFQPNSSLESLSSSKLPRECLMACQGDLCKLNHCCPNYDDLGASKLKSTSKEIMSVIEDRAGTPTLKAIRVLDTEFTSSLKGSSRSYSLTSVDSKTSGDVMVKTSIKEEIKKVETGPCIPESMTED